ncbi:ATP-dependent protease La, partial [Pseudomonas syringae pv. pisi str. 1704B]
MTLPLFPLNAVLFPGCVLDLQLFEARYLDMIGRCMKQGEGFGVVCITEGSEVGSVPGGYSMIGC